MEQAPCSSSVCQCSLSPSRSAFLHLLLRLVPLECCLFSNFTHSATALLQPRQRRAWLASSKQKRSANACGQMEALLLPPRERALVARPPHNGRGFRLWQPAAYSTSCHQRVQIFRLVSACVLNSSGARNQSESLPIRTTDPTLNVIRLLSPS